MVVPPTVYETILALGYHHPGDLYTLDHRLVGERALKERAPTRKVIPGLRAWLARHNAVLVPLLCAPMTGWQAALKDWIPGAVPEYRPQHVPEVDPVQKEIADLEAQLAKQRMPKVLLCSEEQLKAVSDKAMQAGLESDLVVALQAYGAAPLSGGNRRGAGGESHQGGDHIPQGVCREGLYHHEGGHAGGALGAGTPGVLPAS